ncbi:XAC0095 family protein [Luteimonas sp. R10]|uniref:XAC0095 family protein n=1 Tax=Luteimonas sp. R10 TaxID=3108176 RepID=UPI00308488B2|nr:hypothetical protein U3649_06105 [Luteimonas sp. R10]
MSKFDSDDQDMPGYFLPEDSQFRLKKLHEHMVFLSHLAQPRTHDEEQEWVPEIRVGELAVCLELLAEQAGLVLKEVSWPAEREAEREPASATPEAEAVEDEAPEAEALEADAVEAEAPDDEAVEAEAVEAEAMEGEAGTEERLVFGVTLDQMDELDRRLDMITAHGDVVFSVEDADLAIGTLAMVGHAVFDDARAAKDIIGQITSQRLDGSRRRSGVREPRAVYGAGAASPVADWAQHSALPPAAHAQGGCIPQAPAQRLH